MSGHFKQRPGAIIGVRDIEIAKYAICEPTAPPLTSQIARDPTSLRGSRVEFRQRSGHFATLFERFLNFPSASYFYIQCMESGKMGRCYINISRNPFIAKPHKGVTRGGTVGIKGNNQGRKMIRKKNTKGKIYILKNKNSLANSRTWTICTEGRLL